MMRLPRTRAFYFITIPISMLAGYGYATTIWVMTCRHGPPSMFLDGYNTNKPPEVDV